jgi:hypothetical protein
LPLVAQGHEGGNAMKKLNRVSRPIGLLVLIVGLAAGAAAQLPDPGVKIDAEHVAVVITDPQNDFLSPEGVTWGVVGASVKENNTVANIETLMKAAKKAEIPLFISPSTEAGP